MNQSRKPTRRKASSGLIEHGNFSTVPDYTPPWYVALYAIGIVAIVLGVPALMAWTHMQGWW